MFYEVIPILLFRENGTTLTYSAPEADSSSLQIGQIVEIPLGRRKTYGIIIKKVKKVDFATKSISRVIYDTPLPKYIIDAIRWLSDYYAVPLPLVAKLFLPQGLGKKRRKITASSNPSISSEDLPAVPLNASQKKAITELKNISTPTKLLHGITGSGKTNIYLQLTKETLAQDKSVVLLVPEIALTSQLVQIFEKTFGGRVVLLHSQKTEAERHRIWEEILNASYPQIIIGPRSALLSPVKNLGLIIIDEAHEDSYFQDNTPKYSALRLASFIANAQQIPCVLGTATPTVADYYLAKVKKSLVVLKNKAKSTAITPKIKLIDIKDRASFTRNRYFADALLDAISKNLQLNQQTLIFHNRRGSAPLTICEKCGWQALCPNCYLPLNLHSDSYSLICHTCGYTTKVPTACPDCGHPSIIHKGFGTKLLEAELNKLFKNVKIGRFDADNSKEETLNANYEQVKNGDYSIIIGTQAIAKGLDLPRLATVGVVQADTGLSLPDFSAEEKTFELLSQVMGRIGRGHIDTAEAFIQTYQPDNQVIKAGIKSDYDMFYKYAISRRKIGHFPPFYYLAKVTVTYKTEAIAIKHARTLYGMLKNNSGLYLSSPTPAFHERTSSGYNWQITLRAKSRKNILEAIAQLPKNINYHIALDPPSLL